MARYRVNLLVALQTAVFLLAEPRSQGAPGSFPVHVVRGLSDAIGSTCAKSSYPHPVGRDVAWLGSVRPDSTIC